MTADARALPPGTMVLEYRIERLLGKGGFGITYLATNTAARSGSDPRVAIKEYFPAAIAVRQSLRVTATGPLEERDNFRWGLDRFAEEARTLLKLQHPNVVDIQRYFAANGTAYLVMDYVEGETLADILERRATLPPQRFEPMLDALCDGLEHIHAAGIYHRDIKPANIYIAADDRPVLLDFGAARLSLGDHSQSYTAIATPGYGAYEQFSTRSRLGAWTDIYGLSATAYRAITGIRPQDARDRMLDDSQEPVARAAAASWRGHDGTLRMVAAGLAVRPQDRPTSVAAWRALRQGRGARDPGWRDAPPPRPPAPPPPPPPPPPRWPIWLVGGVIALLVVMTAISVAMHPAVGPDAATSADSAASDATSAVSDLATDTPTATPPAIPAEAQQAADLGQKIADTAQANSQQAVAMAQQTTCTGDAATTYWDGCNGTARVGDHTYAGQWVANKQGNCGVSTWDNGNVQRGCIATDGSFTGVLTFNDGLTLLVTIANGEVEGYGGLERADHTRYLGHFAKSRRDGYGIEYDAQGQPAQAGLWRQNSFVGQGPGM